ncbi:hypothetical protein FDP41_004678 [Naegleria fowleri]|uniref:Uncharacterized protein n=1 Tax=Naegleria fowleri TaxID=5763 RepID=A0A6A5BQA1_NAEFO|nr:uncharacterized protein FDP41_004678 [Naegleria fowleri]KAF0976304.1 hypothetical protein FDP41_004678 [Naegleria fowleri]
MGASVSLNMVTSSHIPAMDESEANHLLHSHNHDHHSMINRSFPSRQEFNGFTTTMASTRNGRSHSLPCPPQSRLFHMSSSFSSHPCESCKPSHHHDYYLHVSSSKQKETLSNAESFQDEFSNYEQPQQQVSFSSIKKMLLKKDVIERTPLRSEPLFNIKNHTSATLTAPRQNSSTPKKQCTLLSITTRRVVNIKSWSHRVMTTRNTPH